MSEEREILSHEEIHTELTDNLVASTEAKAGKLGKVIVYASAFHGSDGVNKVEGFIGEDGVSINYGEDQYHRSVIHIGMHSFDFYALYPYGCFPLPALLCYW